MTALEEMRAAAEELADVEPEREQHVSRSQQAPPQTDSRFTSGVNSLALHQAIQAAVAREVAREVAAQGEAARAGLRGSANGRSDEARGENARAQRAAREAQEARRNNEVSEQRRRLQPQNDPRPLNVTTVAGRENVQTR